MKNLTLTSLSGSTTLEGVRDGFVQYRADLALLLIREAWDAGVDYEDLADGFGAGVGTEGDWSAIRDSTPDAKRLMLERALNRLTFREVTA